MRNSDSTFAFNLQLIQQLYSSYHEAYKIAEECCENCKTIMKKNKETDSCYFDFHFCHGGLGMSLDTIRKKDHEDGMISRPWLIRGKSTTNQPSVDSLRRLRRLIYLQ